MLMPSGYTAAINPDFCEGCGICVEFCQFEAIAIQDGLALVNPDDCYGCGVCVDKCAQGAVKIHLDPTKGEPLEILTLMEEVRQSV